MLAITRGVRVITRANTSHNLHPLSPIALVHGPKLVAAPAHSVRAHRLQLHANIETLLEATIWTPLALWLVNVTTPIGHTRVHFLVLHRALEETLAAFASQQAIMIAAVCLCGARGMSFMVCVFVCVFVCSARGPFPAFLVRCSQPGPARAVRVCVAILYEDSVCQMEVTNYISQQGKKKKRDSWAKISRPIQRGTGRRCGDRSRTSRNG